VITGTDIDQRVALITAASETEISDEEMLRLRVQVLRNLIDETLKIQAAAAAELPVSPAEVEQTYQQLAGQNFGSEPKKMDEYLVSIGSSPAALKRQIEGEVAWENLLRRNIMPFVNVSADEVNDVLKRLNEAKGTDEYRLGEIFLSSTAENRAAVLANAQKIMEQLQAGGSFVAYARQFSEATTAVVGGDLGWVRLGQLPPQLATVARTMQPGQLQGPVEIPGGFSILYLIFVESLRGCSDVDAGAAAIGANVVSNDQIKAANLPEQLRALLLNLQIGQTTPAFGSVEEGVRVLMVCGRDDPADSGAPTFAAVMDQIEEERVNKRAQRYLRDLRNDAYIEYN
jgi:peptidyl-prolyl cis-trans isomerase SurA